MYVLIFLKNVLVFAFVKCEMAFSSNLILPEKEIKFIKHPYQSFISVCKR